MSDDGPVGLIAAPVPSTPVALYRPERSCEVGKEQKTAGLRHLWLPLPLVEGDRQEMIPALGSACVHLARSGLAERVDARGRPFAASSPAEQGPSPPGEGPYGRAPRSRAPRARL